MTDGANFKKPAPSKARAPEGMAGLAKGLTIIEAFGSNHEHLTVASAAELAGLSRASARRCLLTLADAGYLFRQGSKYRPTPRMLRLGAAYYESASLPQLAEAHLEAARDELNESISLAIFEEGYAVFVARAEAERIVSSLAKLGGRLPAYASATGRVLLAAQSNEILTKYLNKNKLQKLTPVTITNKDQLSERIKKVKNVGFEITVNELEEGMVSMAVPVLDNQGNVVAAMSMSASSARISTQKLQEEYLPTLQMHASRLSQSL
ncbi:MULTISPECIES: IclR family transcriptional regulator domain-containing protein [Rhodobacterales]|jgi:IclR family pca regulon transcriptional regulator|uniref:IclR family transcriptional regulator n=2 Tax=Rhodobacterales TaxID=204455 RepID=K2JQU9_9RHOB|nr:MULTISPECIES: IclR family transcriptional regulator C-terminal domain-containing protein [Rhodobacterales]EKE67575.1 IclR family transcriptional regulator [Celeribacter baekdonensis B30]SPF82032.1 Pca regulon regulatory protein [Pseudoprimorskyibacter insulae]